MFTHKKINIYDFDIYSRRISFFFNGKEKIGSFFGFFLTIIYVISTISLFLYYCIKAIERKEVKAYDSTIHAQGIPSIEINSNMLYFAFGIEDPNSLIRYIDETIYYPIIYYINKEKENGVFVTKEKINLNLERCNATKFGEKYANLLSKDELNNSYCLKDFNLNLTGGFKYDKFSYIRIKIFPCVNKTENNYHCKPQQIIDSYLSSAYFSILIKDIGLNPLNYTNPIIPTFQNLYDTVDSSIYREFLIYFGITEVQTDIGLLTNKVKKNIFLQFRKFYSTFFLRNETEYPNEKEIFVAQIRLEEYIRIQKRLYTKITETFSIIGGYMKLISNIFMLLTLLTKNINIEKKILNNLFHFNIKQKKIILSVKYTKKLNYFVHYDKGEMRFFIPFGAKKSTNPYDNNKNNNFLLLNKNKSFSPLLKKSASGTIQFKFNLIKNKIKNHSEKFINEKIITPIIQKNQKNNADQTIHKSRMMMLLKEDDSNESQINRIFKKKKKKNNINQIKSCGDIRSNDNDYENISDVNINIFDYFCSFGKISNKRSDIELFISATNFFRNQLSIINVFNIIFLTKIMLAQQTNKKINYLNQTIEIPLKTMKK